MVTGEFLLTALVIVLIPGTGVVYTVSTGLFAGRRASGWAAVGSTLGIVPHLAFAVLGLSAVVHASARLYETVKWAGVLYLLWLAWAMWRDTGAVSLRSGDEARSAGSIVARGAAINLLNPKLTVFFFAFLPQFSTATGDMLLLGGIFMAMTLAVFVVYGLLAGAVRERVVGSPALVQRLQRGFAGVFAVLGLRLAVQER